MTDDSRSFEGAPGPAVRTLRVLVVDDHPVNWWVMQAILGQLGCAVTRADTGEEAVELARVATFDLIVMDLHMPGISGDEAAGRIRQGGPSSLAFIAQWTTETPIRVSGALYDGALPKPVTCGAVVELLDVAQRRAEHRALGRSPPRKGSKRSARLE